MTGFLRDLLPKKCKCHPRDWHPGLGVRSMTFQHFQPCFSTNLSGQKSSMEQQKESKTRLPFFGLILRDMLSFVEETCKLVVGFGEGDPIFFSEPNWELGSNQGTRKGVPLTYVYSWYLLCSTL